uniref:Uncharacterized protein n=1 Tax=Panagrolaimus superbus TaxID=310955 RepID=A0A914Z552_9BILA
MPAIQGGPVASAHEFHRFPGHGNPYMMDPYFYGGGYGGHPYYGGFGGYGAYGGPGRPGNSGRGRGGRGRGGKLN